MQQTFNLILSLYFIIMIHEVGHVVAARLLKVGVDEMAIGLGPKIIALAGVSLGIVPLGGYTRFQGVTYLGMKNPGDFWNKPARVRITIMLAGVVVNIVVGCLFWTLSESSFWIMTGKLSLLFAGYNLIPVRPSDGHFLLKEIHWKAWKRHSER